MTSAEAATISEHNQVLLAVHKAMRTDARRLRRAVETEALSDAGGAAALGRAFAAIVGLIHDHHWTEDDVMYPFLVSHTKDFRDSLVALEDDHVELDATMARLGARLRLLSHDIDLSLRDATRGRIADEATRFHSLLEDHLAREEAIVVPAIDAMPTAEQKALQREESKLATLRHMRMAIPWVLENLDAAEAKELRSSAPRLLALVNDHVWDPAFRRIVEPLYRYAPG